MHHHLRRASRALLIAAVAASSAACATVTRGTSEAWTVETDPSGATVKTTAGFACDATPCTFKMPRKSEFDVTITKAGYKTVSTHVTHQTAGAGAAGMAGNVIVGGLIGVGVDAVSGATQEIKPNPLVVKLEAEGVTTAATVPPAAPAVVPAAETAPAEAPAAAEAPAP
jgi:hypothetical protein